MYINNAQSQQNQWNYVRGLNGNNKNPNMYVIAISSLPSNSTSIIGDSRESGIYTATHTMASAPAIGQTTNRRLTYYHQTSRASSAANIIAPKFRIASSYGVCRNAISQNDATDRCAAYQEDGVPAGRWRVPTRAEVAYIASLSSKGIIPDLFNIDGTYWSASGAITVNRGGTISSSTDNSAFVRCVYDEWFWGDERVNKTTFTWGDRQ